MSARGAVVRAGGPTSTRGRPPRAAVERLLAPLDRARHRLLTRSGALGRRLVRDRELRVGLAAIGALAFAFLGATTFPMVLLALGPVVLGVPHVLADLRYLVSRRGLHRRRLGLLVLAGLIPAASLGHVHVALAGAASVALCSRASFPRRLAVASLLAALAAVAFSRPFAADLAFAHLHNVVAVALWWLWRPRARAWHRLALALYVAASVAFALGLHEAWLVGLDLRFAGFDVDDARASLAPGFAEPWATRAVVAFAFAQSVHYAAWLRLVPEEDRGRPTPRTFRASWRALHADLGGFVLGAAALAALVVAAWALVDLGAARAGYLRAALFHGHLELVALALVLTEGRPARSRDDPAKRGASLRTCALWD